MARERNAAGRADLAYLAARLMAEDGVPDFAAARRKLARQLGIRHEQALPDDRAIADALRAYQALFQPQRQPQLLIARLECAVQAMELLHDHAPFLVGDLLHGVAGPGSVVTLELHSDADKALQMFLLGRQIPFRLRSRVLRAGGGTDTVPLFELSLPLGEVQATVLASARQRHREGGSALRAGLAEVRRLLDQASRSQPAASRAK